MGKQKKKVRVWKVVLIVLLALTVVFGVVGGIVGSNFVKKDEEAKAAAPGNAEQYSIENVAALEDSPLKGKNILFLGSSVTYGSAAQGTSFADYLGKLHGINVTKEAVSATTLVDEFSIFAYMGSGNGDSYVTRLQGVDKSAHFDAVVVQLSTNDASMQKSLGEISESTNMNDFDTKTVTGAIEFIICYAKEAWNCPVIFYTGSYYESEAYSAMVTRLVELQDKWDLGVIDLYNDKELNNVDADTYALYMYDQIHPTKAGYLEWWLPAIEAYLCDYLG